MADADAAEFATNGLDTNWGTLDLKHHAVVRVPDLTLHEAAEYMDIDRAVDHKGQPLAKRRYRLAYETALSAEKVAAMKDPTVTVPVDRVSAPVAKGAIAAKAASETKSG
jgi:hypothetical protein